MTKTFALADILTITHGKLLCHIGNVYKILDFMSGESLMTHQLPRVARECGPELLRQHPDLTQIVVPDTLDSEETVGEFLDSLALIYGTERDVAPLNVDDHTVIDPLEELSMMRPDLPVIVVAP